jgi:hypothetical protein
VGQFILSSVDFFDNLQYATKHYDNYWHVELKQATPRWNPIEGVWTLQSQISMNHPSRKKIHVSDIVEYITDGFYKATHAGSMPSRETGQFLGTKPNRYILRLDGFRRNDVRICITSTSAKQGGGTRGGELWRDIKPRTVGERKQLWDRCGQRCFLVPPTRDPKTGRLKYRYPVCRRCNSKNSSCSCKRESVGLRAAQSRSGSVTSRFFRQRDKRFREHARVYRKVKQERKKKI